jgi:non-ribosomal peptide synthetase component E (peptide arylation enzyme)
MRGYVDPSLDAEAFDADGYLCTGDLGHLDVHGNLTISGRLKDVIIRKGETLSARAIEDELRAHPAVADVAVIAVPHGGSGELACAVIVAVAGPSPTLDTLTGFLADRGFPRRQWPERLELVSHLPRTPTGKVRKDELRQRLADDQ